MHGCRACDATAVVEQLHLHLICRYRLFFQHSGYRLSSKSHVTFSEFQVACCWWRCWPLLWAWRRRLGRPAVPSATAASTIRCCCSCCCRCACRCSCHRSTTCAAHLPGHERLLSLCVGQQLQHLRLVGREVWPQLLSQLLPPRVVACTGPAVVLEREDDSPARAQQRQQRVQHLRQLQRVPVHVCGRGWRGAAARHVMDSAHASCQWVRLII